MRIMNTRVAWRLSLYYHHYYPDTYNFFYGVDQDGEQTESEVRMCIIEVGLPKSGTSDGIYWIAFQIGIAVVWIDTISNKLITVSWNAVYRFGQNDPNLNYFDGMVRAPHGWEQSGPKPASGCPNIGVGDGTRVTLTSWSFLPWSTIISNLGS